MVRNKKVAKALQFSVRNPHAKLSSVAEKFGIKVSQLYHARNYHGAVSKVTGTKAQKRVVAVSTSPKPFFTIEELTRPDSTDMVNHPPHYKSGGIETIDFIEAKGLNYNLGNVVKYITRADLKGDRKENLEKALWYLKRELGV